MRAVLIQLRHTIRRDRRATLSLILMAAVVAGSSMAAAAGARRTESAYPRFVREHQGFHAFTGGGPDEDFAERIEAIKSMPEVAGSTTIVIVGGELVLPARRGRPERTLTFPEVLILTDPSGRSHYVTNRAKVLEGRLPDRSDPAETSIPFTLAERQDIRVGDRIRVATGFDPETFGPAGHAEVTVVGIHAAPGEFEAVGQMSFIGVLVTPAFFERYRDVIPPLNPETWNLGIHLEEGPGAATAFKQKVEETYGIDVPFVEPVTTLGVQKSMRLYSSALWLLAALIGVAGIAIVGQTLARQVSLEGADHPILRALGFSRRMLVLLALLRGLVVGVGAGLLGIVIAVALSPLTPIGSARIAEPDPGVHVDHFVLALGFVGVTAIVAAITVLPGLRAAGASGLSRLQDLDQRPSRIVGAASRLTRSPSTVTGLRLALEPGRGATAVPVRSTIAAVAVAIAAVVGTFFVGSSLEHLLNTPALSGYTYDAIVPADDPGEAATISDRLEQFDFVRAASPGTGMNSIFEGVDSFIVAFDESTEIRFAIIDGRAPTGGFHDGIPEIALGSATKRRLGVDHGEIVSFLRPREDDTGGDEKVVQKARVVGTAAVPALPWGATEPGEGGVMTAEAVIRISPDEGESCCYVLFQPGTDLAAARAELEAAGLQAHIRTKRADLLTLERITGLPALLSAILGAMAIAALSHVLITGLRRRRRDLAILKTIGFVRGQVRAAVAWQASITAVLCGLIGIPLGVILGRIGWRTVANGFGVVPVVVAPALVLAAVIPLMLLVANLVAALPARGAARTQAAVVLRSE